MDQSPINVLLVEDNPGDARLLRETLADAGDHGFELDRVGTLKDGLDRLAQEGVNLVLLDLSLPDSNGLDTFVRVHTEAPGIPIVVLTGLADETLAAAALREGAQDYLVKGRLDPDLLVRSMRYAIERMRADKALRQSEERLRELAVLEERNRMAREIHDTLAQGFTGIVIQIEAAEQVMKGSPDQVSEHLNKAKGLARESLQEARRSVWDLLPRALEGRNLETALEDEVKRYPNTAGEAVSFTLKGKERRLPENLQAAMLRICQESLTNVRRYASASKVEVTLSFHAEAVALRIRDDGVGFDYQRVKNEAEGRLGGFGLSGMEQRVQLLRGSFEVTSTKGEGTLVEVVVPTSRGDE